MKPCRVYPLEQLADFVAGRLASEEAEAVRGHVAECAACRGAAARLARLSDAMSRCESLADCEVPEGDHRRIIDEAASRMSGDATAHRRVIRGRFVGRGWLRLAATAAAAVVIVGGAILLELKSRPDLGPEMARTVALTGKVFVNGEDAGLGAGEALRAGHVLRTAAGSRVSLALAGGAEVDLNEHTSLKLQQAGQGRTVCRVGEGQVYVSLAPVETAPAVLEVQTPVARLETTGARFDLRVTPRTVAGLGVRPAGLTLLAAEGVDVLGHVGPRAEVRVTVLEGQVAVYLWGDNEAIEVSANTQLRYDPALVRPETTTVAGDRFVLWRLSDEEVFGQAQRHLPELFAGQITVLPGCRVRIDYDFLSGAELDHDWRVVSNFWTLHRNALRARVPVGGGDASDGHRAEIVSRAPFVGDIEVGYEVTADPTQPSAVGWAFRYAGRQAGGAATAGRPVAGGAEVAVGDGGGVALQLALEDKTYRTQSGAAPGSVFTFGGRIDRGKAHVSLQDSDVMAETLPDATQRRLYRVDGPEAVHVVVSAGGPDLFIGKVTVIGRPDPRWLRRALEALPVSSAETGR